MTFLGTITTQNGITANNTFQTGTAFSIPGFYPRILIVTPVASGVTFYVSIASTTSLRSSLTATTSDFGLAEQTSSQLSSPTPAGLYTVCAIYASGGAGDCKIYGLWGGAQS